MHTLRQDYVSKDHNYIIIILFEQKQAQQEPNH